MSRLWSVVYSKLELKSIANTNGGGITYYKKIGKMVHVGGEAIKATMLPLHTSFSYLAKIKYQKRDCTIHDVFYQIPKNMLQLFRWN